MLVLVLCMVAKGDFTFGEPTNLGPVVNSSAYDFNPSIRADGLEMYFESDRPGGQGTYDIWFSTRASKEDDWGAPTNLGAPINTQDWQNTPCISADGLELYYSDWGLWVVRRATVYDPWGEPENDSLININTSNVNSTPHLSSDGLSLFLASWDPWDLYVSTRPTRDDIWSEPVNLGPAVNGINSSTWENYCPAISADGLVLVFSSDRPGGYGSNDLWMTRRAAIDAPWSQPVNLGPMINSERGEHSPEISHNGKLLLFSSNRREGRVGGLDIWQASIDPVVDLNSDGIIDAADMTILVDHWGDDDPFCDIGPTPFGDGIVDVQDLIVLAEHLFEKVSKIVIERRISASSDDAEEALNAGFTNWNNSSDLEIVDDNIDNGGSQLIGMTFRDIDIAPGEIISNAYIEFVCDETKRGTDDAYLLIWGHLTPNSDGFVEPFIISNRPKTKAKVQWEPDPWNSVDQRIHTINIAPIIQELIDQEGWAAGNAVEIIIGADPDKPEFYGVRCAESYDGIAYYAPLLHIEVAVQ